IEVEDTRGLGVVEVSKGQVTHIYEKAEKCPCHTVNVGMYLLTSDISAAISQTSKSPRGEYEITDSLQLMIDNGYKVSYHVTSYWLDLSYPWDLLPANESLLDGIEAQNLGEVEENVVEAPEFPQSRFYYWKNKDNRSDIILFIGDDQPTSKGYELANCVLGVGERFQAKRIYTCAAALTRIHHTEPSRVWGVATSRQVAEDLKGYDLVQRGNLHISGLNGLLLGVTKERNIEGVCLLGEVPMYATRIQNPAAALVVLKALTEMLDINIDLAELMQLASETGEKMRQAAAEAMGEYIDNFTSPIWEQGEEEE
ncbi:PAC2 family protein, partial [Chloroflexota bacterium]